MAQPSLQQLLDEAIGKPRGRCVNFAALYQLLWSLLGYLRLEELPPLEQGHGLSPLLGMLLAPAERPGEERGEEGRAGTGQEPLGPGKQRAGSSSQAAGVAADVEWLRRISENANGVTKAMAVSQGLREEMNGVKAALSCMAEGTRKMQEALGLPSSLGVQAGVQRGASVTPEQGAGAASGGEGTSGADATGPGTQPAAGTLSGSAEEFEMPAVDADARGTSPRQGLLGQLGQLCNRCADLEEKVSQLAATKLERSEHEELRRRLPQGDQESISSVLADLQGQVSSLQDVAGDLQGEKGKIRQLENAVGKLESAGQDRRGDGSDEVTAQLRSMMQDIKSELKELRRRQEATEAEVRQRLEATEAELRQRQEATEAELRQRQKATEAKLQEVVSKLAKYRQKADKLKAMEAGMQATIGQLQGHYTKLSSVMDTLQGDVSKKQQDMEALFRSLERLQQEKVDKKDLLVEMEEKADRSALGSTVSCVQFDACMERLNETHQETLSRVTGLEQGWQQLQQQLREGMDAKLDRLELEPFRQQLQEHWKGLLKQLEEKVLPLGEDAAGMKKQLQHFHCLSCDRPLNVSVPGPTTMSVPRLPPLPTHRPEIHRGVRQQEQTRQHGHREQAAECRFPRVPRQCGGQHTLTQPLQRCSPFKLASPSTPQQRPSHPRYSTKYETRTGVWRSHASQLPQGSVATGTPTRCPGSA